VVTFQSVFHVEMYQNDFFYFLKIIFKISISKRSKTYKKINFLKQEYNRVSKHPLKKGQGLETIFKFKPALIT